MEVLIFAPFLSKLTLRFANMASPFTKNQGHLDSSGQVQIPHRLKPSEPAKRSPLKEAIFLCLWPLEPTPQLSTSVCLIHLWVRNGIMNGFQMTRAKKTALVNNDRFDKTLEFYFKNRYYQRPNFHEHLYPHPDDPCYNAQCRTNFPNVLVITPTWRQLIRDSEIGHFLQHLLNLLKTLKLQFRERKEFEAKYGLCNGGSWEIAGLPYLQIFIITLYQLKTESSNVSNAGKFSRCPNDALARSELARLTPCNQKFLT